MDMSDTKLFISLKKQVYSLVLPQRKENLPCQPWEWPDENAPFAWVETNSWEGLHGPLIARWRTAAPKSCQNWAPFHTWVTDKTIFGHGIEVIAIRRPYLQRKSIYLTYFSLLHLLCTRKKSTLHSGMVLFKPPKLQYMYKVKFSTILK